MEDPKPIQLPTVTISAKKTPAKKYREATEKVKLYPKGEVIEKSAVDSMLRKGRGNLIGQPIRKQGEIPMYGSQASDMIKQLKK